MYPADLDALGLFSCIELKFPFQCCQNLNIIQGIPIPLLWYAALHHNTELCDSLIQLGANINF